MCGRGGGGAMVLMAWAWQGAGEGSVKMAGGRTREGLGGDGEAGGMEHRGETPEGGL